MALTRLPRARISASLRRIRRTSATPIRTTRSRPAQRLRTEYTAPSSRTIARGVTVANVVASAANGSGPGRKSRCSSTKRMPMVWPATSRLVSSRASSRASSPVLIASRLGPVGIGTNACCRKRLSARFDAAFVVAFPRAAEARLEEVVRRQRREPGGEGPLAADEDAHDRGLEIVIGEPRWHAAEVGECPDVAIEKADLVLSLVDPREVAARVHQPHQKEPRLPARAVDVEEHLEEIDLGEITRPIRQRHEDLAPLPLPLRHRRFYQRDADLLPLGHQQLVEPRRRQPLLAAGPPRRFDEQRLDARTHGLPHRARPWLRLRANRHGFREVLADGPS